MRAKIRVLHLAKFYPPVRGGMERVLQQLCESTSDDVENYVLAANTCSRTVHERIGPTQVTRAGCVAQIGSVAVCPSFPVWMRRAQADLTVLHEPNAPALVADCLAPSSRPLVVWYHADLLRSRWIYESVYRPLLRRMLRKAASVVVSSPRLAAHADGLLGFRDKCVVVPFGIDAAAMARRVPVPEWLREFQTADRGPMALMVGRMVPYKGVEVFLRALVGTGVSALIVGSGPELERYRSFSTALGLAGHVLFPGNVAETDLLAAYQSCDFFVLPSVTRQEAFGVVQLEAMACGKPVVSTDLPTGVPWVNRHRQTGIVVPPRDVAALRAALIEMATDAPLRERLGTAARHRVLKEFTLENTKQRTLSLYRQVLDRERARVRVAAQSSPSSRREVSDGPA